jgi:hypothetical protein
MVTITTEKLTYPKIASTVAAKAKRNSEEQV